MWWGPDSRATIYPYTLANRRARLLRSYADAQLSVASEPLPDNRERSGVVPVSGFGAGHLWPGASPVSEAAAVGCASPGTSLDLGGDTRLWCVLGGGHVVVSAGVAAYVPPTATQRVVESGQLVELWTATAPSTATEDAALELACTAVQAAAFLGGQDPSRGAAGVVFVLLGAFADRRSAARLVLRSRGALRFGAVPGTLVASRCSVLAACGITPRRVVGPSSVAGPRPRHGVFVTNVLADGFGDVAAALATLHSLVAHGVLDSAVLFLFMRGDEHTNRLGAKAADIAAATAALRDTDPRCRAIDVRVFAPRPSAEAGGAPGGELPPLDDATGEALAREWCQPGRMRAELVAPIATDAFPSRLLGLGWPMVVATENYSIPEELHVDVAVVASPLVRTVTTGPATAGVLHRPPGVPLLVPEAVRRHLPHGTPLPRTYTGASADPPELVALWRQAWCAFYLGAHGSSMRWAPPGPPAAALEPRNGHLWLAYGDTEFVVALLSRLGPDPLRQFGANAWGCVVAPKGGGDDVVRLLPPGVALLSAPVPFGSVPAMLRASEPWCCVGGEGSLYEAVQERKNIVYAMRSHNTAYYELCIALWAIVLARMARGRNGEPDCAALVAVAVATGRVPGVPRGLAATAGTPDPFSGVGPYTARQESAVRCWFRNVVPNYHRTAGSDPPGEADETGKAATNPWRFVEHTDLVVLQSRWQARNDIGRRDGPLAAALAWSATDSEDRSDRDAGDADAAVAAARVVLATTEAETGPVETDPEQLSVAPLWWKHAEHGPPEAHSTHSMLPAVAPRGGVPPLPPSETHEPGWGVPMDRLALAWGPVVPSAWTQAQVRSVVGAYESGKPAAYVHRCCNAHAAFWEHGPASPVASQMASGWKGLRALFRKPPRDEDGDDEDDARAGLLGSRSSIDAWEEEPLPLPVSPPRPLGRDPAALPVAARLDGLFARGELGPFMASAIEAAWDESIEWRGWPPARFVHCAASLLARRQPALVSERGGRDWLRFVVLALVHVGAPLRAALIDAITDLALWPQLHRVFDGNATVEEARVVLERLTQHPSPRPWASAWSEWAGDARHISAFAAYLRDRRGTEMWNRARPDAVRDLLVHATPPRAGSGPWNLAALAKWQALTRSAAGERLPRAGAAGTEAFSCVPGFLTGRIALPRFPGDVRGWFAEQADFCDELLRLWRADLGQTYARAMAAAPEHTLPPVVREYWQAMDAALTRALVDEPTPAPWVAWTAFGIGRSVSGGLCPVAVLADDGLLTPFLGMAADDQCASFAGIVSRWEAQRGALRMAHAHRAAAVANETGNCAHAVWSFVAFCLLVVPSDETDVAERLRFAEKPEVHTQLPAVLEASLVAAVAGMAQAWFTAFIDTRVGLAQFPRGALSNILVALGTAPGPRSWAAAWGKSPLAHEAAAARIAIGTIPEADRAALHFWPDVLRRILLAVPVTDQIMQGTFTGIVTPLAAQFNLTNMLAGGARPDDDTITTAAGWNAEEGVTNQRAAWACLHLLPASVDVNGLAAWMFGSGVPYPDPDEALLRAGGATRGGFHSSGSRPTRAAAVTPPFVAAPPPFDAGQLDDDEDPDAKRQRLA